MVEEANSEILGARGGDLVNMCFQVTANTSEYNTAKVRGWV
jgi:hypothetical protein